MEVIIEPKSDYQKLIMNNNNMGAKLTPCELNRVGNSRV
jgi:hypothetical protein